MINEIGTVHLLEPGRIPALNVPVTIFVNPPDPSQGTPKWTLTADNYMPRKGFVIHEAYRVECDTEAEARALVRDHILPQYRSAVATLERIASGESDHLYHWDIDIKSN